MKGRLDLKVTDLGATQLKNIAEPIRVYSLEVGKPALGRQPSASTPPRLSIVVLPFANLGGASFSPAGALGAGLAWALAPTSSE